jgi:hypothetical protein
MRGHTALDLAGAADNTDMLEIETLQQGHQFLPWLYASEVEDSHLKPCFDIFGITSERCGDVLRQLEMILLHNLVFALPGFFGEEDPDSPCRESGEEEKQHWQ